LLVCWKGAVGGGLARKEGKKLFGKKPDKPRREAVT